MKLPLFVNVPPFICNAPAVHVATPSFSNTRLKSCVVLFIVNVAPLAMIVRPLPVIKPPDQFNVPVIVTSPLPVSVPEKKTTLVKLMPPVKLTVAPLKLSCAALTCAPAANVWLPPVMFTVTGPLMEEVAAWL